MPETLKAVIAKPTDSADPAAYAVPPAPAAQKTDAKK